MKTFCLCEQFQVHFFVLSVPIDLNFTATQGFVRMQKNNIRSKVDERSFRLNSRTLDRKAVTSAAQQEEVT